MAAKESTNYEYLQEVLVNTFNSWKEICNSFKVNIYIDRQIKDTCNFGLHVYYFYVNWS